MKQVSDAVHIVAKMGGYLGRKNDGPPGVFALLKGFRELCVRVDDRILRSEVRPIEKLESG